MCLSSTRVVKDSASLIRFHNCVGRLGSRHWLTVRRAAIINVKKKAGCAVGTIKTVSPGVNLAHTICLWRLSLGGATVQKPHFPLFAALRLTPFPSSHEQMSKVSVSTPRAARSPRKRIWQPVTRLLPESLDRWGRPGIPILGFGALKKKKRRGKERKQARAFGKLKGTDSLASQSIKTRPGRLVCMLL